MRCLSMLLRTDVEEEAQKAYVGNALYVAIQYLSRGQSSFPAWSDCFKPEKKETLPNESAKEVVQNLITKLRRRTNV